MRSPEQRRGAGRSNPQANASLPVTGLTLTPLGNGQVVRNSNPEPEPGWQTADVMMGVLEASGADRWARARGTPTAEYVRRMVVYMKLGTRGRRPVSGALTR